ncbi:hypothetical protein Tco_0014792, partial [Tanacetum coccineum]
MSDSEDSTVTYTEISSPYEDLSDVGSPGAEGPIFQDPPSPDYVPGPEEPEQAPPSPIYIPFVPEPVYPEFLPVDDEVFPAEEQPMPAADSPTHQSPGYIPESDPEEDPEEDDEEDPEEDPADYPADRGDDRDDEEPSDDDHFLLVLLNYIIRGIVPPRWTPKKRRRFFFQVKNYFWDESYAFRICPNNIMRLCIAGSEILEILAYFHSRPTRGRHSASITRRKVYELGSFWPSIFKDARDYIMRCDACYRLGNISSRSEMP